MRNTIKTQWERYVRSINSNMRIPFLSGIPPMEILQQFIRCAFQILPRFPSSILRWVTFPKHQVLHPLPPLVHPTLANGLNYPVVLTLNLLDRGWGLVTILKVGLAIRFQFTDMENRMVSGVRGEFDSDSPLAHLSQNLDWSKFLVVKLLGWALGLHVLHVDHHQVSFLVLRLLLNAAVLLLGH